MEENLVFFLKKTPTEGYFLIFISDYLAFV